MEQQIVTSYYGFGDRGKTLNKFEFLQEVKSRRLNTIAFQEFKRDVDKISVGTGYNIQKPPEEFTIQSSTPTSEAIITKCAWAGIEILDFNHKFLQPRLSSEISFNFQDFPKMFCYIYETVLKAIFQGSDPETVVQGDLQDDGYRITITPAWDLFNILDIEEEQQGKDLTFEELYMAHKDDPALKNFSVRIEFQHLIPDIYNVENRAQPFYYPHYQSGGYDKVYLEQLFENIIHDRHLALYDKEYLPAYIKLYEDLHHIASKYYYGNGSFNGQLGRLKDVQKIHHDTRVTYFQTMHPLTYFEIIDAMFPLDEPQIPLDTYALEQLKVNILKINMKSDTGLLYYDKTSRRGLKIADTILQDFLMATEMLLAFDRTPDGAANYYNFCLLTELKNKDEVYEKEEYETKTRNYWVYNHFSQMPASVIFANVHHEHKTFMLFKDWETTPNPPRVLMGWSPWKLGLHNLFAKLFSFARARYTHLGVYNTYLCFSDNLYCVQYEPLADKFTYFSLDASKMEGCHDQYNVKMECARTLAKTKATKEVLVGYENYFNTLFIEMAVNSIGVVNNVQIPSKAMSSGIMGTSYFNTSKMCFLIHELEKRDLAPILGNGLSPDFTETMKRVGLVMKLERMIEDIEGLIHQPGTILPLDMLGYGGISMQMGDALYLLPILEYPRLLKSFIFPRILQSKKGKGKAPRLTTLERNLLDLSRMEALYLLGAWCYQPLGYEIQKRAKVLLRNIKATITENMSFSDVFQDHLTSLVETLGVAADPKFLDSLFDRGHGVPTTYTLMSLLLTPDLAYGIVAMRAFANYDLPYNLAPPDILAKIRGEHWFQLKYARVTIPELFSLAYEPPLILAGINGYYVTDVLNISSEFKQPAKLRIHRLTPAKPFSHLETSVKSIFSEKPEHQKGLADFGQWLSGMKKHLPNHKLLVQVSLARDRRMRLYNLVDDRKLVFAELFRVIATHFGIPKKFVKEYSADLSRLFHPYILSQKWHITAPYTPDRDLWTPKHLIFETGNKYARIHKLNAVGLASLPNTINGLPDFLWYTSSGLIEPEILAQAKVHNSLLFGEDVMSYHEFLGTKEPMDKFKSPTALYLTKMKYTAVKTRPP